jgi:hypothetical protein
MPVLRTRSIRERAGDSGGLSAGESLLLSGGGIGVSRLMLLGGICGGFAAIWRRVLYEPRPLVESSNICDVNAVGPRCGGFIGVGAGVLDTDEVVSFRSCVRCSLQTPVIGDGCGHPVVGDGCCQFPPRS